MSESPAVSDHTVSWQTAFWAIFSTAGNTFVQDPGIVFDRESLPGRSIRVSPVLCLLDAIWILWQFFATWRRERNGPAAAADAILRERKIDARNLWQGQWYIWFLPGFYAFCQLFKLTCMQGVPFTIVCAWCYFFGYFVLEGLKVIAGRPQPENEMAEEGRTDAKDSLGSSIVIACGLLLHIALTIALMADFPDKLTEGIDRHKDYTYRDKHRTLRSYYPGWYCRPLQYVQIFQAALVLFTNGFSAERGGFCDEILRPLFSVLPATFPLWSITLNRWGILASWLASLWYARFALGVLVYLAVKMVGGSSDEQDDGNFAVQWNFQYLAIIFVIVASIHYTVIYNPEGTFIPQIAEAFG